MYSLGVEIQVGLTVLKAKAKEKEKAIEYLYIEKDKTHVIYWKKIHRTLAKGHPYAHVHDQLEANKKFHSIKKTEAKS